MAQHSFTLVAAAAPAIVGIALGLVAGPAAAAPVSLATYVALERPQPDTELRYGAAAPQAIDVFVPAHAGPHPVAILLHGGCWSATTAGREQFRHIGAALAQRGIAVWSIGYRRANEPGGGYPGTYQDVGIAIDRLRAEADRLGIDLTRAVLIGHSAGGHLALWAAARHRLPQASALRCDDPFIPPQVISIAGVGDLKAFAPAIPSTCGPDIAARLTGAASATRPDPFADTSPAALPAPDAHIAMLSGVLDRLVPPYVGHDHAQAMHAQGKHVELIHVEGAGHFDFVTPGTAAWDQTWHRVERALGVSRSPKTATR